VPVRPVLDPAALALATRQHGLLTDAQLHTFGLSQQAIGRRAANGVLSRAQPGVCIVGGIVGGVPQRILAAVLACGAGTLASHRSAAVLLGADVALTEIDVIVPRRRRGPSMEGVRVHRPVDRHDLGPVIRQEVPVTSPRRTLLDLGAVASVDEVCVVLDHLIATKAVTAAAVDRSLAARRRSGRNGVTVLEAALARTGVGSDSELERRFERLLAEHGLPPAVHHHLVGRYEVDWAYPALRIAVELDGFRWHGGADAFEKDRARDAELAAAGWTVLRFSWRQVHERPEWVADRLRCVLAARLASS
jgi:very-short-patch-repair endonuclease